MYIHQSKHSPIHTLQFHTQTNTHTIYVNLINNNHNKNGCGNNNQNQIKMNFISYMEKKPTNK